MTNQAIRIVGLLDFQKRALELARRPDVYGVHAKGGRNSGKTQLGVYWMLDRIAEGGTLGCFVMPAYPDMVDIIDYYLGKEGDCEPNPPDRPLPWRYYIPGKLTWGTERKYVTQSGARIFFYTAERYEAIRGLHFDWIWADEIGDYKNRAVTKVLEAWGTKPGCKLLTTSTPYEGHISGAYRELVDHPAPGFHVVNCPSRNNPYRFTTERLRTLRASMPDYVYRMKYEGEFTRPIGVCFPGFDGENLMPPLMLDGKPRWVVMNWSGSMDHGFTENHAHVQMLWAHLADGRSVVAACRYHKGIKTGRIIKEWVKLCEEFGITNPYKVPIIADSAAKLENAEICQPEDGSRGLDVRDAKKGPDSVNAGIMRVDDAFAKNRILVCSDCDTDGWGDQGQTMWGGLIGELNSYSWDENGVRPIKEYDHGPDALRYGYMPESLFPKAEDAGAKQIRFLGKVENTREWMT